MEVQKSFLAFYFFVFLPRNPTITILEKLFKRRRKIIHKKSWHIFKISFLSQKFSLFLIYSFCPCPPISILYFLIQVLLFSQFFLPKTDFIVFWKLDRDVNQVIRNSKGSNQKNIQENLFQKTYRYLVILLQKVSYRLSLILSPTSATLEFSVRDFIKLLSY